MIAALDIYNQVKSFDSMVDKALGTFNKKKKQKSSFGKPNKHYSFLRVPNFENILLLRYYINQDTALLRI